jgi:hypothetical protein
MNQRSIVRSLTTADGLLVGMNDGTISWKPVDGRPHRTKLEGLPTVLLALRGPMGAVDTAVVGCADGELHVLTLPRLETIAKYTLASGSIRAVCLVAEGTMHFLVGTQHGAVWSLDERSTERSRLVFTVDGPVSSLHLEGELVHVRSGWVHHVRSWDGSHHDVTNTSEAFHVKRFKRLDRSYTVPNPA